MLLGLVEYLDNLECVFANEMITGTQSLREYYPYHGSSKIGVFSQGANSKEDLQIDLSQSMVSWAFYTLFPEI